MRSLLLDRTAWDLVLDARGNLAIADDPYAQAQDAACAARLFQGEAYYDTTIGVPYFQAVLGKYPSPQFMRAKYATAAARVPGVQNINVTLTGLVNRRLTGNIVITNDASVPAQIGF